MEKINFSWLKTLGKPSAEIKYLVASNSALVSAISAYAGIFVFFSLAPYAPTIQSTLGATPDWASGFDIYLTFPILTILCILPFKTTSKASAVLLLSLVAGIPIALELESYYLFYGMAPVGFLPGVPYTLLLPTVVLLVVLTIPTLVSILLAASLPSSKNLQTKSGFSFAHAKSKYYFLFVACVSLALAFIQTYLRVASGATINGWVSDIGITVEAGARDLIHGINPYTHGLPPWGGPGGTYGPMTYLFMAPFAYLPQGWGAHIGALFFTVLTSLGIWKCTKLFRPKLAVIAGALFLALPTTSWIIEGGMVSHVMLAALIVWSLYFFFKGNYLSAGLVSALGLLALVIPGILIIPYIIVRKSKSAKIRIALGYFAPILLVTVALLAVAPGFLFQEVQGTLIGQLGGGGWLTLDLLFSPAFTRALSLILTSWLVLWLVYRSFKVRYATTTRMTELISVIGAFLILIPFAIGDYFVFFYVWASAVAVMAIFGNSSLMTTAQDAKVSEANSIQSLQNVESG